MGIGVNGPHGIVMPKSVILVLKPGVEYVMIPLQLVVAKSAPVNHLKNFRAKKAVQIGALWMMMIYVAIK